MSDNNLVKIKIPLDGKNLADADAEWVWAQPLGEGTYRVDNVPFYAKGLSCEDVVKAETEDGALTLKGIVRHGGHSTYRVYANEGRTKPAVVSLLEKLKGLNCDIEPATDKLVGVDVLPEANIYAVYEALAESERSGVIDFDEGHCGHALKQ
jgi:hypothetical protein